MIVSVVALQAHIITIYSSINSSFSFVHELTGVAAIFFAWIASLLYPRFV